MQLFYFIFFIIMDLTHQSKLCEEQLRHESCQLLPDDSECGVNFVDIRPRIILGKNALVGEFPWMVQLLLKDGREWYANCGGALINSKYVITAAHCYEGNFKYKVLVGGHKSFEGKSIPVKTFIINEKYHELRSHNDIALLELEKPVKKSKSASPICLPMSLIFQSNQLEELPLEAAGFGIHKQKGKKEYYPSVLQKVALKLYPQHKCKSDYYKNDRTKISSQQICTSNSGGKDTCGGDSGGPLMAVKEDKYVLVGVISFGDEECGTGLPNVHVRVQKYLKWILDNMSP